MRKIKGLNSNHKREFFNSQEYLDRREQMRNYMNNKKYAIREHFPPNIITDKDKVLEAGWHTKVSFRGYVWDDIIYTIPVFLELSCINQRVLHARFFKNGVLPRPIFQCVAYSYKYEKFLNKWHEGYLYDEVMIILPILKEVYSKTMHFRRTNPWNYRLNEAVKNKRDEILNKRMTDKYDVLTQRRNKNGETT